MTLREMIEAGIGFEGYRKVQCWVNEDYPEIYHAGNDFHGIKERYLDREVRYIFPYQESDSMPGITIELYEAENEITKEILRNGYEKGIVKFITDPNMEAGTVCSIGEYWFYFSGTDAEEKNPEEFLAGADMEEVLDRVLAALDWLLDENEDNGDAEYNYYYAVLRES